MNVEFFRKHLNQMIDLCHPLAVLANRMPWQEIEASIAQRLARQVKAGKKIEDLDLFSPVSAIVTSDGVSNAGRPRLPTRMMVALLYLKHAFNESDEYVNAGARQPLCSTFLAMDISSPCGRYALVRQFKRISKVIKRQRTIVGRPQSAMWLAR